MLKPLPDHLFRPVTRKQFSAEGYRAPSPLAVSVTVPSSNVSGFPTEINSVKMNIPQKAHVLLETYGSRVPHILDAGSKCRIRTSTA